MAHQHDDMSGLWNERVFTDLSALIGASKAEAILQRFRDDLPQRVGADCDREAIRKDAHTLVSMAGMLGFATLSAAARDLEGACQEGSDIKASLLTFMRIKVAVTALVTERLSLEPAL